jgi:hypothetical protein
MDPESKWLRSVRVGDRSLAMAHAVLHPSAQRVAPDCGPLFLRDGTPNSLPALGSPFGHWVQPPRRQTQGPRPTPRWMPFPARLYAQGVKTRRRRRLVEGTHRGVCGTKAAGEQVLAARGWQINTAFVERRNLSLRQRVAAMRRRSAPSCKSAAG